MTKEQKNLTEEVTAVLEEIAEDKDKKDSKGEVVVMINETEFMIGSRQYKLLTNYREGFDTEKLGERYSEVLARYDYIVGDWGYEQLRLKGFFEINNRKALPDQRIDMLEDYLYEYCNFGCAYFVIQRTGGKREKTNNRRRKKRPAPQAHVAEKKETIAERKKPVIKKKHPKEQAEKKIEKKEAPKDNKKGFTIRKREN